MLNVLILKCDSKHTFCQPSPEYVVQSVLGRNCVLYTMYVCTPWPSWEEFPRLMRDNPHCGRLTPPSHRPICSSESPPPPVGVQYFFRAEENKAEPEVRYPDNNQSIMVRRRLDIPTGQQTYRALKVKLILLVTNDQKTKNVIKFNQVFFFQHIFNYIILYWDKEDFLIKANFALKWLFNKNNLF